MSNLTIHCRAVLFDLDGVLVDSLPHIIEQLRAWATSHGLDSDRIVALSHGRTDLDVVRLAASHLDAHAEVNAIQNREVATAYQVHAAQGARRLVAQLKDFPWAVVTSGCAAVAKARLAAAGFRIPRVLVTSEDVTAGKPDPQCYATAAARLGVPASQCLVIEDAPAGVAAARAAGMPVVGVAGTAARDDLPADVVVGSLDALAVLGHTSIEITQ